MKAGFECDLKLQDIDFSKKIRFQSPKILVFV